MKSFAARLAQGNLVTRTDFNTKLISLNEKNKTKQIKQNTTKNLLAENELKKLKTFDSSYFWCKSHFLDEIFKPPATSNNILAPALS